MQVRTFRQRMLLGLVWVVTAAFVWPVERPVAAEPLPPSYANPVLDLNAADPTIVRVGATYYAFTTGTGFLSVPVQSSTDLVNWSSASDALPTLGSWASWGHTWAPEVLRRTDGSGNGYWVLYYTARHTASGDQCIGRAIAYDPPLGGGIVGPYDDTSPTPLICQNPLDGSIDADAYVPDPTGTNPAAHLFWKSNEAAVTGHRSIWSQPLSADGLSFRAGSVPAKLLESETGWENLLVEGPTVVRDPGTQSHVLLYAACRYNQPCYATGWATCTGTGAGATFAFTACSRGQTGSQSEPFMAQTADVKGPGGADVFEDQAGHRWLAYHGYKPSQCTATSCSGARQLRIDRLCMLNGVPRTSGPSATPQPFARSIDCLQDVDPFGWGHSAGGLPVKGGWDIDSSTAAKEVTLNGPWPNQSMLFRGNPSLGDQTARVEVQWAATGPAPYPKYGMLALFQDLNNHVSVWLDKKNGLFLSYVKVGGVSQGFQNTALPGFDFAAFHELKVVKTGTSVGFYLDGILRHTRTVALSGGQIGLITEDTKANYRDASQT